MGAAGFEPAFVLTAADRKPIRRRARRLHHGVVVAAICAGHAVVGYAFPHGRTSC